jgi:methyltransferase-like protein/trans-aconitate methyltransferase
MSDTPVTSYDEFPYESRPFEGTHPARLAAIAHLHGMRPAPPDRCRVLELGCAGGGNLMPMAAFLPHSEFVGIDLSRVQIDAAKRAAEAVQLANVRFHAMSITDVAADFGTFDYIIAHGVYSWVPDAVREKILAICAANLAPGGVAYISYNTYPGWHMRGMIREMLRFHANRFSTARERVAQIRRLLDLLGRASGVADNAYAALLRSEIGALQQEPDHYLLHEYLEDVNHPLYFHQFVAAAERHALEYLNDVDVRCDVVNDFAPGIRDELRAMSGSAVDMEQYVDFVRSRTFRRSLLVHRGAARRGGEVTRLHDLAISAAATPTTSEVDLRPQAVAEFRATDGTSMSTSNPLTKVALLTLKERAPQALSLAELRALSLRQLAADRQEQERIWTNWAGAFAIDVLGCCSAGLATLYLQPGTPASQASPRPRVHAFTRYQAATGNWVTNRLHQEVTVDEFTRQLLQLLDGSRAIAELRAALRQLIFSGTLKYTRNGAQVSDPAIIEQAVAGASDHALQHLAKAALLES